MVDFVPKRETGAARVHRGPGRYDDDVSSDRVTFEPNHSATTNHPGVVSRDESGFAGDTIISYIHENMFHSVGDESVGGMGPSPTLGTVRRHSDFFLYIDTHTYSVHLLFCK